MHRRAVSCIVILAAALAVASHRIGATQALTPSVLPSAAADAAVVGRVVDAGMDIVRMPPEPLREPPPAVSPPPSRPEPMLPPEPQPLGRVIKLPVTIGRLASDTHKGWLGVTTETVGPSLAAALGLPSGDGLLILDATPGGPAGHSGTRFGDIIVAYGGEPVGLVKDLCRRVGSTAPDREAVLDVWRAANGDFPQTLHRLADAGNAGAMFRLGRMYATGTGVTSSETAAVDWFRKAAAAGNAYAMTALAGAYVEGRGVDRSPQEAVRWLKAASDKGHLDAMRRLGVLLIEGKVVAQDAREAVRVLTKAAEAGHAPAMVDIGQIYHHGLGVPVDAARAAMWYRRAIDLGNSGGMLNLGILHQLGKGVAQSDGKAVELYRRAADLGNPYGIHNLGGMLERGKGAKRDPQQAADLVFRALELGNRFSYQQMTKHAPEWSPEFRRALQARLRDGGLYSGPIDGAFGASTVVAIDALLSRGRQKDRWQVSCSAGGHAL